MVLSATWLRAGAIANSHRRTREPLCAPGMCPRCMLALRMLCPDRVRPDLWMDRQRFMGRGAPVPGDRRTGGHAQGDRFCLRSPRPADLMKTPRSRLRALGHRFMPLPLMPKRREHRGHHAERDYCLWRCVHLARRQDRGPWNGDRQQRPDVEGDGTADEIGRGRSIAWDRPRCGCLASGPRPEAGAPGHRAAVDFMRRPEPVSPVRFGSSADKILCDRDFDTPRLQLPGPRGFEGARTCRAEHAVSPHYTTLAVDQT